MKISPRLEALTSLVTYETFADIGTDHGYAPIYLCKKGKIKNALACDLRKGPLEKAKENISKYNLHEKIETRLGSGFSKVKPNEVESALIAGMGGMLIISIIENNIDTVNSLKELILSPHEDIDEVRRYIHKINFTINEEITIKDENRIYIAFRCIPVKEEEYKEDIFYEYGKILLEKQDELLKELILNRKNKNLKAIENIKKAYNENEVPKHVTKNLELSLVKIEEALKWFVQ